MVPPIVIGTHCKRHEPEPIELGLMLSRLTHAPIDVVGTFWFDTTPHGTAARDYGQILRDRVEQCLERAVDDARREFAEVRTHVISESATHALQETARQVSAGLIVVGSAHRTAIGPVSLRGSGDRVLPGAPCPVAVAPGGFRDEGAAPRRVGVAFVDTPGGWAALRAGAAIARHTGAGLVAFTVIESHTSEGDRTRAEAAVEQAIANVADDARPEARVLTHGGVGALVAESRELDFLVRGSRGHGPLRSPLVFGLPSKLARGVACPLVVVPPELDGPLVALFGARGGAGRQEAVPS